ncbi:1,3-beta-glucan synthase component-domain-containing protein [Mycena vulgaris]|nr:1,3-beta-glucan synthase component-domain-containing protein [Mycena vulgaris]
MIPFAPTQEGDRDLIELAFSKKKADDRKEWLRWFKPGTYPEALCFIFKCADDYYRSPESQNRVEPGAEGMYLRAVVRPLYRFIRDQGYEVVHGKFVRRERDPEDIIDYDDVNQLFWYPEGIARIVLQDKTRLVDLPPAQRFMCFDRIDWSRAFFKTYYETRSFGHLLVNFNSIWVIHIALYFFYTAFNSPSVYAIDGKNVAALQWSAVALGGAVATIIMILATLTEFSYIPTTWNNTSPLAPAPLFCGRPGAHVRANILRRAGGERRERGERHAHRQHRPGDRVTSKNRKYLASQTFTASYPTLSAKSRAASIILQLLVFGCKFVEFYFYLPLSFSGPICAMVRLKVQGCSDKYFGDALCRNQVAFTLAIMYITDLVLFFLDTFLRIGRSFSLGLSIWTLWADIYQRLPKRIYAKLLATADMEASAGVANLKRDYLLDVDTANGRRSLCAPPFFIAEGEKESGDFFPRGSEAERRISFFAQSLTTDIPAAIPVDAMPTFTALTPHYSEKILLSLREIIREEGKNTRVTLLEYLKQLHPVEWENFVKDTKILTEESALFNGTGTHPFAAEEKAASKADDLPFYFIGFKSAAPEFTLRTRIWSSLRAQTLYRTVSGMMNYAKAIKLLYRRELERMARRKFKFFVAMQRYSKLNKEHENAEFLLRAYPDLQIAYLEEEPPRREGGEPHIFSALIDGQAHRVLSTKIGTGMGEQMLSREYYYLGTQLPIDRFLTFYYGHPGFHINNMLVIFSVQIFIVTMVFMGTLNSSIRICQYTASGQFISGQAGCYNLPTVFSWIRRCIIKLVERGTWKAIFRLAKQFGSLSPLFEVFSTHMSQPAREFIVKIFELSLWSSDLILGHILLLMLTPPVLIPYFDRFHATILCALVTTFETNSCPFVLHQTEETTTLDNYKIRCAVYPRHCTYCVPDSSARYLPHFPASRVHCNIAFGELVVNFPEVRMEEVTRLTISMLLQRLRSAEPTVEAAIAYNLVDLALSAPESAFIDIIRVFSVINRSANPDDPRFSNNMVLAAQTRLAQDLDRCPELYEIYLVELLTLFADKGVAIQNLKISNHHVKTDDMIEQLASLLLPIDALLAHEDFNPQLRAEPTIISLFRNMWFLCILFGFTSPDEDSAMEWQKPALCRIAIKTPSTVLEESHDSVASNVEYNSVVRQDYTHTITSKHKSNLTTHIALRASDIRSLSSGQIIFLLTMHDMESMCSAAGLTSSLVSYFINDSLNKHPGLSAGMESIAEKVIRGCVSSLNAQASQQALPECLSTELRSLLICSTHRIAKARDIASKYLNRLITSFPSLMCDPPLVFAILEVLTLLRRACENEFTDEYNPTYEFYSDRTGITLQLTDSYTVRNEILGRLHRNANNWFELALGRAPVELQSTLQKYLSGNSSSGAEWTELGASVAEQFGKAIGPVQRQLVSLSTLSKWKTDGAKSLASQVASKGYFAGEAAGIVWLVVKKLPPQAAPSAEIQALKGKMARTLDEIRSKVSSSTVQDLKRLLFRCAATLISLPKCDYELLHYLVALPFEVSTPSVLSSGIEIWTWVIAEKPDIEVGLMGEVLAAWSDTIRQEKGIFSTSLNYDDPFYHPIDYSPTDKDIIDHGMVNARRLLTPHALVLQMLFSLLHSARAHKRMSTHPLAREPRFSFLLFGFETLKSSHLDSYCKNILRDSLYSAAYSWFASRPQWSYGANRVQVDADIKVEEKYLLANPYSTDPDIAEKLEAL